MKSNGTVERRLGDGDVGREPQISITEPLLSYVARTQLLRAEARLLSKGRGDRWDNQQALLSRYRSTAGRVPAGADQLAVVARAPPSERARERKGASEQASERAGERASE
eukprot:COSAG03_NODE_12286_length_553_cov_2.969163_1_plen_110_part_00